MIEVKVPDIGDFTDVPIVEVLVAPGDTVAQEDPLVALESDKATMEIPAPQAGVVGELKVKLGDTVSEGTVLLTLEPEAAEAGTDAPAAQEPKEATPPDEPGPTPEGDLHAQVLILGSGPGGYTAAFRAADLGLQVVLVERYPTLGGVCLNVGCIPSKALLHVAKAITDAESLEAHAGVKFGGAPEIDLDQLRTWKDEVVGKLVGGVGGMAGTRKVEVVQGRGTFTGPHTLTVEGDEAKTVVTFDHAIVATGSRSVELPGFPHDDPRVMDSTDALAIEEIPGKLLVVGGGIIGLEMATVYDALGSEVTVVELADQLIPGCDPDLVKPLKKRIEGRYAGIHLSTKVESLDAQEDGIHATFGGETHVFDRVLVAVGRTPNGKDLGLQDIGVTVDERGYVPVDPQQRTSVDHVFAIGDVVGNPMLAHKASHEAKVAAEVIAGEDVIFDARGIPSVAYTEPEIAWVGLTETQAKADGTPYEAAIFPWSASGRALATEAEAGRTKLLLDPETHRVLGAGIVGTNAGELIHEPGFALELGATAADIGLTVHAHPTLMETVAFAAEVGEGVATDLPPKRKRAPKAGAAA